MTDGITHNHVNFQGRLKFIRKLMSERYGSKPSAIEPISYDPTFMFKYNNFVYRVRMPSALAAGKTQQPGTIAVPKGTTEFILRLTNPDAEGMNPATRIENEVAIISLARDALKLKSFEPHIVPSVYGWGTAAPPSRQGWILQELLPGATIEGKFGKMSLEQKRGVLAQMATILGALQAFQLPGTITGYGGVTFNQDGKVVSTAMTNVGSGPWPSYEAFFRDRLHRALKQADESVYLEGWKQNGVRDRLEAFIENGVSAQFQSLESRDEKAIVHMDFTLNNLLYDDLTGRITGLIDYDFACILHPSYEFFRSFGGAGGQFQAWSDITTSPDLRQLRDAKLNGFPSPLPETIEGGVEWEVAKAWEDELENAKVKRPSDMKGIERVADVDAVYCLILPWRLTNSDILQNDKKQSEETKRNFRAECEEELIKMLDHLGF